ncbi:hypothetical protein PIB30_030147 [Stylosanthes scabra]|uniref:Uncharacterized protein n=1 Tax=Stylosanthes scabra TaxID=79078 RepID=A0ABU6QBY5_9FABA|nr:hypothetical protein [Stylosanthes scabra]
MVEEDQRTTTRIGNNKSRSRIMLMYSGSHPLTLTYLQIRTGVLFFEYPIVQMYGAPDLRATFIWGEPRIRIYGFYDRQFTFPLLSPYFDPDAPYDIPLSSLHPWMPPPPPAPPAEVFEEDDDEMAQAGPEGPPVPPEMDGMFPSAPVPAQPLQMATPIDDVPDPPLANGHISSLSEEDPEEDSA